MEMFDNPELDARMKGVIFKDIPTGTSEQEYIFPFDCMFNGLTVGSNVTKLGSSVRLETRYQAGPSTWLRYKKFGDSWNLYPGNIDKNILFPTKPKAGIKLVIIVENNEGSPIDIAVNLYQFADSEIVIPQEGQQGVDW